MENKTKNIIQALFTTDDINIFRDVFLSYHPFDLAEVFVKLEETERKRIYNYLSPKELAPIFVHLDIELVLDYFEEMNSIYISYLLEEMDIDDCVDILYELGDRNKIASYLSIMKKEKAYEIRKLLQYEEKTAGSIMTTDFIEIPSKYEVKQAMKKLIKEANEAETIYTLYIVDDDKKLVGTISLRELILARSGELIKELMNSKVVSVDALIDQEEVAKIMRDYDFNSLPVLDYQNHIIGIITIDDVIDVIDEEASEDYERLAAVNDIDEIIDHNSIKSAISRLPWLIILLILGLLNSNILNGFEDTLSKIVALAFFLPLIAGMAGNTGTQSLAITIRKLTTTKLDNQEKIKHVLKEVITGLLIGLITSILAFIFVFIILSIQNDANKLLIALLVSIAIAISVVFSTFLGALVPLLMTKLKIDPAVASGPFITTLNDLISMSIYLGLATYFINNII